MVIPLFPFSECIDHEVIPDQLKSYNQWVVWKWELRNGKMTKVPVNPRTQRDARTNAPHTWGDFEQALKTLQTYRRYEGLGFVFSKNDPFVGIDWDKVRDLRVGLIEEAIFKEEILPLGSYAEVSPSGSGVHVIAIGSVPGDRKRGNSREMYTEGRFFTVTGEHIEGTPATVEKASKDVLERVYRKMVGETGSHSTSSFHDTRKTTSVSPTVLSLSDEEIIARCLLAKNSPKFRDLFERGDFTRYHESKSEADMALCGMLAFYTNDHAQIDRIFRQSHLYREKWDEMRGVTSYGAGTINKVVRDTRTIAHSVRCNSLSQKWRIPRRRTFSRESEEDRW